MALLPVGDCTDTSAAGTGDSVFTTDTLRDCGRALAGNRTVLVASRRLGNKVGVRTCSSMVSRRNLWSQ